MAKYKRKIKKNNERDFKGVWIPREIWLDENLSLQEKAFLAEIGSLDGDDGCWANNTYFADFFKLSKRRVSLVISELIKKNRIKSHVDKSTGNKRILNILSLKTGTPPTVKTCKKLQKSNDPIPQNGDTPIEGKFHTYRRKAPYPMEGKFHTPMEESFHHNNTNTNNKIDNKNNNNCDSGFDEKLALELEKAKQKAAAYELELHQLLPARTRGERTTYNRLREHLTELYLAGDRNVFVKVKIIAKEVRVIECDNRRGLFIAKCKKETGFKSRTKKLL